ncbi:hypothetical protein ASPFODRAFT_58058 [Aspergillus luchuensis CBS 106.47]|uniref:Cytochrome P450 n=1 Tax=Aspergillus luchuensis (strain CBS 106.47) TaxID=1137211 RepID=A0A1M3TR79_ASPLC|nr:hypothetical protein ASPFODRAFT_58058 [Aspergillus luchuensis CBS 106.47]
MDISRRLPSLEWHDIVDIGLTIGIPLAKFPGPLLAAATELYEFYYDVIRDGQFVWHIERLHQKYGPVVCIKPWEIHVKDPDNYNTLYAGVTRKRNQESWFTFVGWPTSIFSPNGHALHRARRSVLGQFFRRQAILDVEPLIQNNIRALCTASKTKMVCTFELVQMARHFPWICKLAHLFPWPAKLLNADFVESLTQEREVQNMVRKAIQERGKGSSEKPMPVYPAILENDRVPEDEKRFSRLADDANLLVLTGTDAPGRALVMTLYFILRDPEVHRKLHAELCASWPDASMDLGLIALEKLPYFTAVLKEGLRLGPVVSTRLPRVAPDEILQFHGYEIPRGVSVSMTAFFIHRDPKIFPGPLRFIPQRWLLEPEDLRKLERYLVPFSRGTLGCLGPNMAWAWLYLVLGTLLRRFEMTRDKFLGQTERGKNRVQIKVVREYP